MKRLLTFLMALALCLGALSPAALAADASTPLWERAGCASKAECLESLSITAEEYAQMEKEAAEFDADAYLEEQFSPWFTREELEEMCRDEGRTLEAFLFDAWLSNRAPAFAQTRFENWKESHRDLLDGFDAEEYFAREQPWWASPEEYMESFGMTEEEFIAAMEENYLRDRYYAALEEQLRKEQSEALLEGAGGKPGKVNVMVNGACIPYSGAAPELTGGRTMVPLRATMEALGAQVEYAGQDDISYTAGGFRYTLAVGKNTVTVRPTSAQSADTPMPEDMVMDCVPYLKDNCVYVPLRFLAEALGYDVFWDGGCATAVLLDPDAVAAELDKDFSICNEVLSWQAAARRKGAVEGSLSVRADVTLLDSISGDQTYAFSGRGEALFDGRTLNLSGSADLSGLIAMLKAQGLDDESVAQMQQMLRGVSCALIASEEGVFLQLPMLAEWNGDDGESWYLVDDGISLDGLPDGSGTVGRYIYDNVTADNREPLKLGSQLSKAADELSALVGNDVFSRSGSGYTWTLSGGAVADLADADNGTFRATFRPDGSVDCRLTLEEREGYGSGAVTVRLTGSASASPSGGNLELKLQLRNQAELRMNASWSARSSGKTPATRPPEGAVVVE